MKFISHKQALVAGELPNHPTHGNPKNPVLDSNAARKLKGLPEIIDSDDPPWDVDDDTGEMETCEHW